jgi:hypothetical protein
MKRIFWGFCLNRFGIGPLHKLHYIASRSDFCFEFVEIFVIEKPASWGVTDSPTRRVVFRLRISPRIRNSAGIYRFDKTSTFNFLIFIGLINISLCNFTNPALHYFQQGLYFAKPSLRYMLRSNIYQI